MRVEFYRTPINVYSFFYVLLSREHTIQNVSMPSSLLYFISFHLMWSFRRDKSLNLITTLPVWQEPSRAWTRRPDDRRFLRRRLQLLPDQMVFTMGPVLLVVADEAMGLVGILWLAAFVYCIQRDLWRAWVWLSQTRFNVSSEGWRAYLSSCHTMS